MEQSQDRIIIFDTTLRDGEQSPGATLNVEEKLEVAHALARLGVDVIEAGFPYASPGDFEAVQKVAAAVGTANGPTICGLARATKNDIKAAAEALKPAAKSRIHTFLATSDIHLEYKLRKTRAEVLAIVPEMVSYAKSFVNDVEFSPEDAGRSEPEFLYQVLEAAIAAGATTVNIPDTVGYTTPSEFGALIKGIKDNVPNIDRAIISVHGHNDLGLAVANFLEAIKNGARQLECTINGIGERAGNAALEELVMALHVRRQYFNPFFGRPVESTEPLTQIDTKQIYKTSRLVSNLTGMAVQPNKAIVNDEIRQPPELFRLELVQVSCGDHSCPTATVTVRTPDGEELTDAAIGTGPVDAIYKAINRVAKVPNELIEFSVQSVTGGIDAMGEVTIRLRYNNQVYSGYAANTDIVVASARAYIKALNRLYAALQEAENKETVSTK